MLSFFVRELSTVAPPLHQKEDNERESNTDLNCLNERGARADRRKHNTQRERERATNNRERWGKSKLKRLERFKELKQR